MAELVAHTNTAGQVSMRNADTGEFVWIPKERAQEAYQAGFEPEAPAAFAKRQEAVEFDQPWTAAGAGFLRGATLGASDVIATETGLVEPETLSKLQEHNPVADPLANVAGTVVGALVPGGALARGGALAARAGGAVAARAGGAIAARALPMVARSAAEGAILGTGHAVSEAVMHPEVATASHIAKGALEGLGIGGAMGVGFLGAGAALRGTLSAGRKLANVGKKSTGVAEAAMRQAEGGADILGGTGWSRLANMRQEMADNQRIITALRRGGATDDALELAQRETRRKVLGSEYNKLQSELLGGPKAATKRTTTTTTEAGEAAAPGIGPVSEQSLAQDLAQMEGRVLEGIEGEIQYSGSIWRRLSAEVDKARVAGEAAHRMGLPVDAAMDAQYGTLRMLRKLAKERTYQAEQAAHRVRKNSLFKPEGEALVKTGQVPGQSTIEVVETATARANQKLTAEAADVLAGDGLSQASLKRLTQLKTPGMLDHFLNWRSASTFLGWSFGGPVGGVIGALLGDSAIRRTIGDVVMAPMIRAASGVGSEGAKAIAGKAATAITAAGVESLRSKLAMPHNDPEQVAGVAYVGYTEAGMADSHAAPLAAMQGAKTQLLREAVEQTDTTDPASRLSLARKVDAVSDLRSIGARMRASKPTREDVYVLNRLFPSGAKSLALAAAEKLASADGNMGQKTRRALEMLAGEDDKMFSRLETIQSAFAGQGDDQDARTRKTTRPGSQRIPRQQATTMQRIQGA